MLGRYENFPQVVHGIAQFASKSSMRRVQQEILSTLHQLNHEVYSLNNIAPHYQQECDVSFEVGAAEDIEFNYLDEKELDRFQKSIVEKNFSILDFFYVVRYHLVNDKGKRIPLKFDYHLLRFTFQENRIELGICHEQGPQRVSLEDLINFIKKRVNEELSQKRLKPLDLKYLRALY